MNHKTRFHEIQRRINELDEDRIHLFHFSYDFNLHNVRKSPLMIVTRLFDLVTGSRATIETEAKNGEIEKEKRSIDHVCHISRFIKDGDDKIAKIFEASLLNGMEQNDLRDKLENLRGCKVFIETLGKVDKEAARRFENQYLGIPYSKKAAAFAGIDIHWIQQLFDLNKTAGRFCSWLIVKFLRESQMMFVKTLSTAIEATPVDVWKAEIGIKKLYYVG